MSSNRRVYGPGGSYALMYVALHPHSSPPSPNGVYINGEKGLPPQSRALFPDWLDKLTWDTCRHDRAGVDAARAFGTGCFKEHRTHDLRGLSESEIKVCFPVIFTSPSSSIQDDGRPVGAGEEVDKDIC